MIIIEIYDRSIISYSHSDHIVTITRSYRARSIVWNQFWWAQFWLRQISIALVELSPGKQVSGHGLKSRSTVLEMGYSHFFFHTGCRRISPVFSRVSRKTLGFIEDIRQKSKFFTLFFIYHDKKRFFRRKWICFQFVQLFFINIWKTLKRFVHPQVWLKRNGPKFFSFKIY